MYKILFFVFLSNLAFGQNRMFQTQNGNVKGEAKSTTSSPVITNGLVLHLDAANPSSYPGSGNIWTDLSGNNNNATLVNSPTFSSANQGSLVFSGTNYGVINNSSSNLIFGASDFTFSWWQLASASNSNTRIFGNLSNNNWISNNWVFAQNYNANKIDFFFVNNSSGNHLIGASTIAETWQNVLLTRSGNTWSIYINNSLKASLTNTASVDGGVLRSFYIGSSGWLADSPWKGNIANILIYNRLLSTSELTNNFDALKSRFGL